MVSVKGSYSKNVALAPYTTWRVGGAAEHLFLPADAEDLQNFLKQIPDQEPITFLGLGSNTLIRDNGIKGIVIITQGALSQVSILDNLIRAESGVASPALARQIARLGLTGLEFLAGIPGTIGGALTMNAGCNGGETWNFVKSVETINRCGEVRKRSAKEFEVTYRSVKGLVQDEWFLAGYFELKHGDKENTLAHIRALLAKRAATQPTSKHNCGSVFRNPPGDFAGRLIESSGLKGKRINGAFVSPKHANFIINDGTATAEQIENLIEMVTEEVLRVHHVKLIREVRILGS